MVQIRVESGWALRVQIGVEAGRVGRVHLVALIATCNVLFTSQ